MGTTTTNLGLYKPDDGEDGWGAAVNANWDLIDELLGMTQSVDLIGIPQIEDVSHVTSNQPGLPSSAKTTEQIVEYTNADNRGLLVVVPVTVDPASAAIKLRLEYKDVTTGSFLPYFDAAGNIDSVATYKYLIYPGVSGTAPGTLTETFPWPLPRTFRLRFSIETAGSLTYSMTALFLN